MLHKSTYVRKILATYVAILLLILKGGGGVESGNFPLFHFVFSLFLLVDVISNFTFELYPFLFRASLNI